MLKSGPGEIFINGTGINNSRAFKLGNYKNYTKTDRGSWTYMYKSTAALGKTTFDKVSTSVFKVSWNSAPILFLTVSIEVVTFFGCAKRVVEKSKMNIYILKV